MCGHVFAIPTTRSLSQSKGQHLFANSSLREPQGANCLCQKKTLSRRRTVMLNLIQHLQNILPQLVQTLNQVQGDGCGVAYLCKTYYVYRNVVPALAAQRQAACRSAGTSLQTPRPSRASGSGWGRGTSLSLHQLTRDWRGGRKPIAKGNGVGRAPRNPGKPVTNGLNCRISRCLPCIQEKARPEEDYNQEYLSKSKPCAYY